MNPKDILLGEISQTQNDKISHDLSYMWDLKEKKTLRNREYEGGYWRQAEEVEKMGDSDLSMQLSVIR